MNKTYNNKFIPQNNLAEEILLGIFLVYPNVFFHTINIVKKEHFFLESHELIYINLIEIYKDEKISIIELFYRLKINGTLKKIGGLNRIISIMRQSQTFVSSSQVNTYVEGLINILNNHYIKRLVIQYGYNIIKLGHMYITNNKHIYYKILFYLKFIEQEILGNDETITNIKDLISRKLLELKSITKYLNKNNTNFILKSGFQQLDKIIQGFSQGNLIILAGRPSIGKTSFAINIAYNTFINQKRSICIFSLEMSSKEILNKLICIACKQLIDERTIKKLSKHKWQCITKLCNQLINQNIYINDKYNIEINNIETISKSLKKKNQNICLIIIDYLQLIEFSSNDSSKYNRSQELGYITRKLKLLAQILDLPIVVLSQLNRNIEIRHNKEPLLSDLKESGCISNYSNINILDYYNNNINIMNVPSIKLQNITVKSIKGKLIQGKSNTNNCRINETKESLYFFQQYIFNYTTKRNQLKLTYDHRHLLQESWLKIQDNILSTTVSFLSQTCEHLKYVMLYKKYTISINIKDYSKTYDINKNSSFNLICKNFILHNSIEQDADIIIMLYDKKEQKDLLREDKTLDIKISKNRNGNTGECQIIFTPTISVFKDINKSEKNIDSYKEKRII
uniref:DNA 5'-3' helicase n=1 Tax=Alsidium seaforthii TaxID=2007182 RepID=A0A1Z1ME43_9FLOR|nr:Replication helicase subunit [Bryothamnion seaforthii]ARW64024.1 Replication helicase subunit [Bryothamnion seaforthii]